MVVKPGFTNQSGFRSASSVIWSAHPLPACRLAHMQLSHLGVRLSGLATHLALTVLTVPANCMH